MQSQQLDIMFHALSDPYRRTLVEKLSRGPASVTELAGSVPLAMPSVVKHLQVLEGGGIVRSTKAGRVRTYGMRPDGLNAIGEWVRQREATMNRAFDRLAQAMIDVPERRDEQ